MGGQFAGRFEAEELELSLDENDSEREYEVQGKHGSLHSLQFYVMVCIEGSTKKLKFYNEDEIKERNKMMDKLEFKIDVNIKRLNMSFISWTKQRRREVALLSMKDIELILLQTCTERTQ